jgi:hypothetical protein
MTAQTPQPAQPEPGATSQDTGETPALRHTGEEKRGPDRRKADAGSPTGLERRRGPGRRLSDYTRAAEEGELNQEQFLFVMAIEGFKKANNKVYPSWTDVLEVVRLLGYRKTLPASIKIRAAEDWQEPADAPAAVRPIRREDREAA